MDLTSEEAHSISQSVTASADGMLIVQYARRWWFDQAPLALDVGPIDDSRGWAVTICEQAGGTTGASPMDPAIHNVSLDLTPTGGLLKQAPSPVASTVAEAGMALRLRATHVAPGLVCEASCAEGLEPLQIGERDEASTTAFTDSTLTAGLPIDIARCHSLLQR